MEMHQIYCPACNRRVRLVITDAGPSDGQATLHDEEAMCLDVGERCGGACPLGATAPDAMVGRMVRAGVSLEEMHRVHSVCPSCGLETEMALYGDGKVACTTCGSTARWTYQHAEPM